MTKIRTILESPAPRCTRGAAFPDGHACEFALSIGLFFDGTGNNMNVYTEDETTNTNVARLFHAYRNKPVDGHFSYYVSGVGTPFSELQQAKAALGGGAIGAGGEARIVYGLLQVANAVHRFLNDQQLRFEIPALTALCSSNSTSLANPDRPQAPTLEQEILTQLGLSRGLVGAQDSRLFGSAIEGERRKFFRDIDADLRQQVAAKLPVIKSINLDVFGFSRGAALARVFVNWLHDLLFIQGTLFGVPASVRMLGLFDTVAAVGLGDGAGGYGHGSWATASNLRIHPEVKNCVHYVALHELRSSFPLDGVAQDGVLPPNCHELYCPGAHSDVGGGYGAGEQGKGVRFEFDAHRREQRLVREDGLKLSTLPLNEMLAAAKKACRGYPDTPWIEFDADEAADLKLKKRFHPDRLPKVREAVGEYFDNAGVSAQPSATDALREHGLRYLAWRYRVSHDDGFGELASVQRAGQLQPPDPHLGYYLEGEKRFKSQVRLLSTRVPAWDTNLFGDKDRRAALHSHASEIFKRMQVLRVPSAIGYFFDAWVHDSYAGFMASFKEGSSAWTSWIGALSHSMVESQGYVRWRGLYEGSDERLNGVQNGIDPVDGKLA